MELLRQLPFGWMPHRRFHLLTVRIGLGVGRLDRCSSQRKAPAMRGLSVGEREWKDSNLQPPVS